MVIGGYDLARDEDGEPVPLQLYLKQFREATLNASYNRFTLDGNIDRISCQLTLFSHICYNQLHYVCNYFYS